jgi:hypothetical protein
MGGRRKLKYNVGSIERMQREKVEFDPTMQPLLHI